MKILQSNFNGEGACKYVCTHAYRYVVMHTCIYTPLLMLMHQLNILFYMLILIFVVLSSYGLFRWINLVQHLALILFVVVLFYKIMVYTSCTWVRVFGGFFSFSFSDLDDESTFRDLSKPIGALNEERLQKIKVCGPLLIS